MGSLERIKSNQAEMLRYYQSPAILYEDERYRDISDSAIILYTLLYNRVSLSISNNWIDDNGDVYIIYTIDQVVKKRGWGKRKAVAVMQELIDFGLIQRERKNRNQAYRIYVMDLASNAVEKQEPVGENPKFQSGTSRSSKVKPPEVPKWNPRYIDNRYIDNRYMAQPKKRVKAKNQFNDFNQRDYDMTILETAMLNRPISDSGGSSG